MESFDTGTTGLQDHSVTVPCLTDIRFYYVSSLNPHFFSAALIAAAVLEIVLKKRKHFVLKSSFSPYMYI